MSPLLLRENIVWKPSILIILKFLNKIKYVGKAMFYKGCKFLNQNQIHYRCVKKPIQHRIFFHLTNE